MSQMKVWVINPNLVRTQTDAEGTETKVSFYTSDVIMTTVLDEDEVFDPPPWIREGVENQGWRVLTKTLPPSGLNDMATVDWRSVAQALANALEGVLQQEDLEDQGPTEVAGSAMDDYRIAEHEEALRSGPDVEEMVDPDDE